MVALVLCCAHSTRHYEAYNLEVFALQFNICHPFESEREVGGTQFMTRAGPWYTTGASKPPAMANQTTTRHTSHFCLFVLFFSLSDGATILHLHCLPENNRHVWGVHAITVFWPFFFQVCERCITESISSVRQYACACSVWWRANMRMFAMWCRAHNDSDTHSNKTNNSVLLLLKACDC